MLDHGKRARQDSALSHDSNRSLKRFFVRVQDGLHSVFSRRRDSVVSVQRDVSAPPRAPGTADSSLIPAQGNEDLQISQRRPISPGTRIPVTSSPQAINSFDFARKDDRQISFVEGVATSQHPENTLQYLRTQYNRWRQYAHFLHSTKQQLDDLQTSDVCSTDIYILIQGGWNLAINLTELQQILTQKALEAEFPLKALSAEINRRRAVSQPFNSVTMTDRTDQESSSPRWNISPLLEEYLVSKGQVRMYEERISEHETQRLESMDVRQRHEDQELSPDEWHEKFLETFDAKLAVIEADLLAAEAVRDRTLQLCLEAGIDVNAPIQPDSNGPSEAGDHSPTQEGPSDAEQKELLKLARGVMAKQSPLGSMLDSGDQSSVQPSSRAQEWLQQ